MGNIIYLFWGLLYDSCLNNSSFLPHNVYGVERKKSEREDLKVALVQCWSS